MHVYVCVKQYCECPHVMKPTNLAHTVGESYSINFVFLFPPVFVYSASCILLYEIMHVLVPPLKSRHKCGGKKWRWFPQIVPYCTSHRLTNHMLISGPIIGGSPFVHLIPCFTPPFRIPLSNPNSRKFDTFPVELRPFVVLERKKKKCYNCSSYGGKYLEEN